MIFEISLSRLDALHVWFALARYLGDAPNEIGESYRELLDLCEIAARFEDDDALLVRFESAAFDDREMTQRERAQKHGVVVRTIRRWQREGRLQREEK